MKGKNAKQAILPDHFGKPPEEVVKAEDKNEAKEEGKGNLSG